MEQDRHLPLQGIPKSVLSFDKTTGEPMAVKDNKSYKLEDEHQEATGGRQKGVGHNFYALVPIVVISRRSNDPLGY